MSLSIFTTIQTDLDVYGSSIFIALGYVGNVFIIILFSRQRQNACGIYLLSSAIVNILDLTVNGFIQIFPYNYTTTTTALIFCKIYFYLRSIVGQVAKTMIILACVDRYLITSERASFRAISTPKRAKRLIGYSVIFWLILCVHIPIMYTINRGQCGTTGIYSTFFTIFAIVCVGGVPSIILGMFGYLAERNMRKMQLRIRSVVHNPNEQSHSIRRKDHDFLIIVIAEVFVYVITIVPFPLIFLEIIISQYILPNKSLQHIQIEYFILDIAYFLLFLSSATPFYIYLITSKAVRRDTKQLIINSWRKIIGQQQQRISNVSKSDGVTTQQDTGI